MASDISPADRLRRRADKGALALALLVAAVLYLIWQSTDLPLAGALAAWAVISLPMWLMLRRMAKDVLENAGTSGPAPAPSTDPLRPVLDRLPVPLVLFGADRRIRFKNRAAGRMLGMDAEGKDFAAAIRHPDVLAAVDHVVKSGEGADIEFQLLHPMSRQLRVRIEELPGDQGRQQFLALIDDLTADHRLSEVRSDFVADVSHELRTPLASILSVTETLTGPAARDPAAQAKFLGLLEEQASRMARIVDDLLSLSRIEMNEHQRPDENVNLSGVMADVIAASRVIAEERDVEIAFDAPTPIILPGDALELTRLFQNLVDNAVKYGDRGSTVSISVAVTDEHVAVLVENQGPGIAREHIPRLTERFYRVDRGRSRAAGGTGLGLAIVKHIVNRHRGRLRIESEAGEGACFTVELPLSTG